MFLNCTVIFLSSLFLFASPNSALHHIRNFSVLPLSLLFSCSLFSPSLASSPLVFISHSCSTAAQPLACESSHLMSTLSLSLFSRLLGGEGDQHFFCFSLVLASFFFPFVAPFPPKRAVCLFLSLPPFAAVGLVLTCFVLVHPITFPCFAHHLKSSDRYEHLTAANET